MTNKVLILGGNGRIGGSVAQDIATNTDSEVIVTGRSTASKIRDIQSNHQPNHKLNTQLRFLCLDLANIDKLASEIAKSNLVVHCAGPFHHRDTKVLELCIKQGVNYLDVSDHRSYTIRALEHHKDAVNANVTAIVNTGIFPGISNSMVRQCVEQFDEPEKIHLSYVVSGSGGAGITVMRTTFLGLQNSFEAWIEGDWKIIKPYTDRETIDFPSPYGPNGVYWYDMPETYTLPKSFPGVSSVITKFGSVPDFYNHLTWIAAHVFPRSWLRNSRGIEFLSHVSHLMTDVTDRFSGIGVAVCAEVIGSKNGNSLICRTNLIHENTAIAAGCGTGTIAQLLLEGKLRKAGVFPVEEALPTNLFLESMESRGININQDWI